MRAPINSGNDEDGREESDFREMFSGPEGRRKKYKWLSLLLVFLFLAGGGFIAWFMMKNAAHKLVGGDKYTQLASNSSLSGERAGIRKTGGFFASEEELAKADPALKNELLGLANEQGSGVGGQGLGAGGQGPGAGGRGPESDGNAARVSGKDFRAASAAGAAMRQQLAARESAALQSRGAGASKTTAFNSGEVSNTATIQRVSGSGNKTAAAGSAKASKISVLDSLKRALRSTIYGARDASRDAARNWTAKAFDGAADSEYSVQYDEKMKAQLDRVNPNSIPRFLKDQNVDPDSATTLGMSRVAEPEFDEDATREALKNDEEYQKKKSQQDFLALLNPLFGGLPRDGNGNSEDDPIDRGLPEPPGLNDLALEDYIDTFGYGGECGCSPAAPCCCLPPNYYNDHGMVGDFPPAGDTMFV